MTAPASAGLAGRGGGLVLALAFAVLGAAVVLDAAALRADQGYARIGPAMFPYAVGAGLVAIGALLAISALRGNFRTDWTGEPEPGMPEATARRRQLGRVALAAAALLVNAWLIEPLGFVIAATLLFCGAATAFGAHPLRALGIGLLVAGVTQLVFSYGLGLSLPAGRIWAGA